MIGLQTELTDIFFDLDHTLWDFEKNSYLTFKKIFSAIELPVDLEDFISFYNPINHAYWKQYRENRITQQELRFNRLSDTFTKIKHRATADEVNQISEAYIANLSSFPHLFEGAIPLLDKLK